MRPYKQGSVLTRSIDDIDSIFLLVTRLWIRGLPITEGSSTLDRDTLLSFQVHAVHLGTDCILASHLECSINEQLFKVLKHKNQRIYAVTRNNVRA